MTWQSFWSYGTRAELLTEITKLGVAERGYPREAAKDKAITKLRLACQVAARMARVLGDRAA